MPSRAWRWHLSCLKDWRKEVRNPSISSTCCFRGVYVKSGVGWLPQFSPEHWRGWAHTVLCVCFFVCLFFLNGWLCVGAWRGMKQGSGYSLKFLPTKPQAFHSSFIHKVADYYYSLKDSFTETQAEHQSQGIRRPPPGKVLRWRFCPEESSFSLNGQCWFSLTGFVWEYFVWEFCCLFLTESHIVWVVFKLNTYPRVTYLLLILWLLLLSAGG